MALLLSACDVPDIAPNEADIEAAARGRAAAVRLGCAACHVLPGVDWPRGGVGPDLGGFADRALIGGRLPNRPDVLARFVADAPALLPGTAMPAIPMSAREASDIASWLTTLDAR